MAPSPPQPLVAAITPVRIGERVASVDAGDLNTCATTDQGHVFCWGPNGAGQLGAGIADAFSDVPLQVLELSDAMAVAVGWNHSCALRRGGKVSCWGENHGGQAGHGTAHAVEARRLVRPVEVRGIEHAVQVQAGESRSCALRDDGVLLCWGLTCAGGEQPEAIPSPRPFLRGLEVRQFGLDRGGGGCALLRDGSVRCWQWPAKCPAREVTQEMTWEGWGIVRERGGATHAWPGCVKLEQGELLSWSETGKYPLVRAQPGGEVSGRAGECCSRVPGADHLECVKGGRAVQLKIR